MTTQCLIVDDEPPAIRLISSYIQQIHDLEIAAACNNAIDAFKTLQKQKIDLIFLDIKMPRLPGLIIFLRTGRRHKAYSSGNHGSYAPVLYACEQSCQGEGVLGPVRKAIAAAAYS